MKVRSLPDFERSLGEEASVYLLSVSDAYDRQEALDCLLNGREATVLQGERLGAGDLADELNTRSLFEAHRVVVVHGAERLASEKEVLAFCTDPCPFVTLVLCGSVRSNSRIYKVVEQAGVVLDIASLKPWEQERVLGEWLVVEARKQGKELQGAAQLVSRVGRNKGLLHQELDKLVTYVGDASTITPEAIRLLAAGVPTEALWELGKAVLGRNPGRAVSVWRDLVRQGSATLSVLAALRGQLHKALILASIAGRGGSRHEMAQALPQLGERALYRALQEAQKYGERRLQRALLAVGELELRLKNENLPEETVMDILILRLAA